MRRRKLPIKKVSRGAFVSVWWDERRES